MLSRYVDLVIYIYICLLFIHFIHYSKWICSKYSKCVAYGLQMVCS